MSSPGSASAPAGALVSTAGERSLVDRIRARVPPAPAHVLVGIGDDAAVVAPDRGALQVYTTDALVEGVHFDRRFSTPSDIGFKALAVNVSDVASMGGTTRVALLSLMLPSGTTVEDVDGLLDGILAMAAAARMSLVGGNITKSPGPLVVDVTAIGSVRPRKILTRGGGRPGDAVFVTGSVGASRAGLEWLRTSAATPGAAPDDPALAACVARYRRPDPRIRVGALLGRTRAASACMDTSDGLADAVLQVAHASGTGARIDAAKVPLHSGARAWFTSRGDDAVAASLADSDDYELLFTVPKRRRSRLRSVIREARGLSITEIGELTPDPGVILERNGLSEPMPSGFVHF